MSEDNAQNHANFADAFSMTARAIKIDKRLPYLFGGWAAGNVKLDRSKITSLAGLRALVRRVVWRIKTGFQPPRSHSAFFWASHLPQKRRSQLS
jgi:hypothetical protein